MLRFELKTLGLFVVGAVVFAWATPRARAEEPPAQGGSAVAEYEFEDDLVRGDGVAPTLEVLHVRTSKASGSLVRARLQFVDRLVRSAEML